MTTPSLALGIFRNVGLTIALMIAATIGLAFYNASDDIPEVYDAQMVSSATVLWSLTRSGGQAVNFDAADLPLDPSDRHVEHKYAKWRSYRIWQDGRLVRSVNTPNPKAGIFPAGFTNIRVGRIHWRIFTLDVPADHMVIEVGENLRARGKLLNRVMRDIAVPVVVSLPLIALGIWLSIGWSLRRVKALARDIAARSPEDLSPVSAARLPREIGPLVTSLNSLFGKLTRSMQAERLFTDNAAHELRTPLANLAVHAEILLQPVSEQQRRDTTEEVLAGIRRASRLLEQLLTLARVRNTPLTVEPVRVYDLVRELIIDMYPRCEDRRLSLSLEGDEEAVCLARKPLLRILVQNLLDNAIKYSPPGEAIDIHVGQDAIRIRDHGPGIAEEAREQVFQPFFRLNNPGISGSGLGLSIVRTICEVLHLRVDLTTPDHGPGLNASIIFGHAAIRPTIP